MNFEESLVTELSTITELEGRIFPLHATEGTNPPFVIYVSSEGEKTRTLDGYEDLTEVTAELHVVAESYEHLKALIKAVLDKIQTFFGRNIGADGVYIKSLTYTEPEESFEDELNYHRSSFEITVRI